MTILEWLRRFDRIFWESMRRFGIDFRRPQFYIVTTLTVIAVVAVVVSAVVGVIGAFSSPKPSKITFGGVGGADGPRYGTFGPLDNTISNELAVPVLYGQVKLAGNVIWRSDPGETVSQIIGLCEGPINAINDVRANDVVISEANTPGSSYSTYLGDSAQEADSRVPADLRPDLALKRLANVALTLKASENLKGGNPTITSVAQGLLVETWDGSAWTTTKSYSRNPAACIRDFIMNSRYGMGAKAGTLNEESFGEVYEYCNDIITPSEIYEPDVNTLLLLHFDGNFDDSSPSPKSITNSGWSINSNEYLFGTGSGSGPGSGYVEAASSPSFGVGTGDFTVDFRLYLKEHSSEVYLFKIGTGSDLYLTWHNFGGGRFDLFLGGQFQSTNYKSVIGSWIHVSVVRKDGVVKLRINGKQINSNWSNSTSIPAGAFRIGSNSGGALLPLNGLVDEFRYSNVARWDADFNPPKPEDVRFRLDYVIDSQRPGQDVLNEMLSTFGGFLVYSGSKIKLRVEKPELITQYFGDGSTTAENATFDPNNIVKDSMSWNLPSVDERANRIRIQWVDPSQNYVKVYTQVDDFSDQEDRGGVVVKDVALLGITRQTQASRMAKMYMTKIKYASTSIQFSSRLESIQCEIGDVIAVTHQSARYVRKLFRITNMQEAENEMINFTCTEYNESLYDDRQGAPIITMQQPSGPNLFAALNDVTGLTLMEDNFINKDGVFVTNILASWTALSEDELMRLDRQLIQISSDGGVSYRDAAFVSALKTSYRIVLGNVQTGATFTVRVKTISDRGAESVGVSEDITIQGKTTPPSDVEDFDVSFAFDRIAMSWSAINDEDLFGYEIRVGDANSIWETAVIVTTEALGTTYDLFNFTRGTKKFFIKAIDNSANYSENAAVDTIVITDIPESNVVVTFDVWSRITAAPHPLQGTLSSDLDRIPTNDYAPEYNRLALQPKTTQTWLERQQAGGTWADLQASAFRFGREEFVTTEESYETDIIDLGARYSATFILDIQTFSSSNLGFVSVQISTSNDNITFTDFRTFVSGNYDARYIKLKFLIQATDPSTVVRLISATLTIDVPDRYQRFSSQAIGAGGSTINLTGFTAVKSIVITTVGGTPLIPRITSKASLPNSFDMVLDVPAGGTSAGDVDIYVSGY